MPEVAEVAVSAPAPAPAETPAAAPAPAASPAPTETPSATPSATPTATPAETPAPEAEVVKNFADMSPAEQWESTRNQYGEKKFGDLTAKEAQAALKELGRYATQQDAIDALLEAKRTLRAGKIEKSPGKDAAPEVVAEWRAANGIPEKVDDYFEKLPDGLIVGDDDLPVFKSFAEALHGENAKPAVIHAAVKWYNDQAVAAAEARATQDVTFRDEATASLKKEYGGSFEKNLNIADNHIAQMFGLDQIAILKKARAPDGRMLFDIPEVVHGFLKAGLEIDPAATLMPGGGGGQSALASRLEALQEKFKTDRKGFYEAGHEKEMNDLLEATAKIKKK